MGRSGISTAAAARLSASGAVRSAARPCDRQPRQHPLRAGRAGRSGSAVRKGRFALDAECFEAYFNLGNIHHDLARYPEAVAPIATRWRSIPAYPEAHFYLAVTLEKLGRSPEAKPHWREYRELAPDGEFVELAKEFSD